MGAISEANLTQASIILGYSPPTLRKFIAQGMPVKQKGGNGKDYTLDLPACIQWLGDQKVKNAIGDVDAADIDELKKRKLAAETTIAEIEAAKSRGEVVFVTDALKAFTHEAIAVKARILAVPQRLAAALAGITDQRKIKQILTDELHSAFEELSARSVDVDTIFGAEPEPDDQGKVATSAQPKAKRVGGAKRTNSRGKRKTGKN